MAEEKRMCYSLLERIEGMFDDIEGEICRYLRSSHTEYKEMLNALNHLHTKFPIITALVEGEAGISLTAEEHKAFAKCQNIRMSMDELERINLYVRGQSDCYAWLKRINAI